MTDLRTRVLGLLRPHVAGVARSTLASDIVTAAEIVHKADVERLDRANAKLALDFAAVSVERDSLRGVVQAVRELADEWEHGQDVTEWNPLVELRAALGPVPRPERKLPTREDVLEYHRLSGGDIEDTIDYALSLTEPYATPRWDEDPIVIGHGWLDGRCGRCGEPLPAALAAAADAPQEAQGLSADLRSPDWFERAEADIDAALAGIPRSPCGQCKGSGSVGSFDGSRSPVTCYRCAGTGRLPAPMSVIEYLRLRVIDAEDRAAADAPPQIASGCACGRTDEHGPHE